MSAGLKTVLTFVALIFTSAILVFSVQPMVGRMLLPRLGGTAVVWNTCLVFFQAALLLGYLYAHALSTRVKLSVQIVVHLAALGLAAAFLPIDFGAEGLDQDVSPALWLLGQLSWVVGLPFVIVSASAPLFQSWFARTGHRDANDPYYLYAASNVGSMLALLGYPFLIEPNLGLAEQSMAWAAGYGVLFGLVSLSAVVTWRGSAESGLREPFRGEEGEEDDAPSLKQMLWWIAYSAVPSALLVSVTAHITTDIVAVPLLWMVPLTLYLLTFVVAFARFQLISTSWLIVLAAPPAMLLALTTVTEVRWLPAGGSLAAHVGVFFFVTLMFHKLLARERPPVAHLTKFFLIMSLGGVIGGAFVALLAPLIFDTRFEYPLLLGLSGLVYARFNAQTTDEFSGVQRVLVVVLTVLAIGWALAVVYEAFGADMSLRLMALLFVILLGVWSWKRPRLMAAGFAVLFLSHGWLADISREVIFQGRSYFGHLRVRQEGGFTVLSHGRTIHGKQHVDPGPDDRPTSYYHPGSGVAHAFSELDRRVGEQRVAIVGLGAGALAHYANDRRQMDFYEIDPLVVRVAQNPDYFTFLSNCGDNCDVIVGDARIRLSEAPDAHYDMIVEDAFNSDAIPVHLLTIEAMELYVRKLKGDGLLLFHLSNQHFDLVSVVARLAKETGLSNLFLLTSPTRPGEEVAWWFIAAKSPEALGHLPGVEGMKVVKPDKDVPAWTDDFADVWSAYYNSPW